MKALVGTSGWLYDWNEGGDLRWYVENSGLNAVELNASFYRFPFPSQVKGWSRTGASLRWAVKVHRSVTHVHRLNERALEVWGKFRALFRPMEPLIDFYLFQMPPNFAATDDNISRLQALSRLAGEGPRFAVEFRHPSWFAEDKVKEVSDLSLVFVSISSPVGTYVFRSRDTVYLRMHGTSAWYAHEYSREELDDIIKVVLGLSPREVYVFFNNDHWMLENARYTLARLTELAGGQ
ncbi:MAG: DUF72 domain-containing protein [Acidilobus sp.]